MRNFILIAYTLLLLFATSCVQETHKRTVVYNLDVSGIKNIKKVGIRGWDAPLSWDTDYPLKEIVKDSLYQVTITGETGRLCCEVKFAINDKLELDGKDNRKIYFKDKDKLIYNAKFNIDRN